MTNQSTSAWWNPSSPPADLVAVVLAAGQGKRMKSGLVKVLHPLRGRPLLQHVLGAVREAGARRVVVVVGVQEDLIRQRIGPDVEYVRQGQPLGTAHAVLVTEPLLGNEKADLLVVYGDTPLLDAADLRELAQTRRREGAAAAFLTAFPPDPTGYGRVLRSPDGAVRRIVEEVDCAPAERLVREVNAGVYCFWGPALWPVLKEVGQANAQGERYLPDVVEALLRRGEKVVTRETSWERVVGINDRGQLARVEGKLRRQRLEEFMTQGVTVRAPEAAYVDDGCELEKDTVLEPGVVLEGEVRVRSRARIGPFTVLRQTGLGG